MTTIGVICGALAIVNGISALFYSLDGQSVPAILLAINFAVLGGMVRVGVFG